MDRVVIVGAGQGGFQVAASLRENGFEGSVTLVGDEPGLPYGRPPLSKSYVIGKTDRATLDLRAAAFFAERRIAVRAPERAVRIDRERREVRLGSHEVLGYDHLVLATGARARPLPIPGADLGGVHLLRTVADADAIKADLANARRVAVIGAGFIGLEFAAAVAASGRGVAVLEATGRPMARAVSGPISSFFRAAHERAGIRLDFGAVAVRITGESGRATGIETGTGEIVAADLVVVGIGVVPNTELAAEAGLAIGNGIVVDAHLATSDAAISALGDCASFPNPFGAGAPTRLESIQNAVDHAKTVAARLCGRPAPYRAVPWFWSDQGPLKLQIAGVPVPHGDTVLRGDPESGAFSVFCFEGERLASVESVNRPADHMVARRLLAGGIAVTHAEVADLSFDLKARVSGRASV